MKWTMPSLVTVVLCAAVSSSLAQPRHLSEAVRGRLDASRPAITEEFMEKMATLIQESHESAQMLHHLDGRPHEACVSLGAFLGAMESTTMDANDLTKVWSFADVDGDQCLSEVEVKRAHSTYKSIDGGSIGALLQTRALLRGASESMSMESSLESKEGHYDQKRNDPNDQFCHWAIGTMKGKILAAGDPNLCDEYMQNTGCGWTEKWSCPGEPKGSVGFAGDDDSHGYFCCCEFDASSISPEITPALYSISRIPITIMLQSVWKDITIRTDTWANAEADCLARYPFSLPSVGQNNDGFRAYKAFGVVPVPSNEHVQTNMIEILGTDFCASNNHEEKQWWCGTGRKAKTLIESNEKFLHSAYFGNDKGAGCADDSHCKNSRCVRGTCRSGEKGEVCEDTARDCNDHLACKRSMRDWPDIVMGVHRCKTPSNGEFSFNWGAVLKEFVASGFGLLGAPGPGPL